LIDYRVFNSYQIVLVDVGIYWRYYKWLYNPNIRIPSSNAISVIGKPKYFRNNFYMVNVNIFKC